MTAQDDDVGLDGGRVERLLLEVQVAENVQAHAPIMTVTGDRADSAR